MLSKYSQEGEKLNLKLKEGNNKNNRRNQWNRKQTHLINVDTFNKAKSWSLYKSNKINNPLARLRKIEKIQIFHIIIDHTDVKRLIKEYFKQLYASKFKLGLNGQISWKIQFAKTETRKNRKFR